jgi:hypothetical protein
VTAALLLALAAGAAAQAPTFYNAPAAATPAPAVPPAPAVSTAAAVDVSTLSATVSVSKGGFHVAGDVKPKLTRPIRAIIPAEAKDWEPVSLKPGGDPVLAETKAVLRQAKVKGKLKGSASKAKATARLIKGKDEQWLVLSIFPTALEARRAHFEIRLRLAEGFVENVKASIVTIVDRRSGGALLNSDELRARGVEFEEDSPASGHVLISALDPRPSKTAFNGGTLKLAAFADENAGLVDVSWSVTGLTAPR